MYNYGSILQKDMHSNLVVVSSLELSIHLLSNRDIIMWNNVSQNVYINSGDILNLFWIIVCIGA